VSGDRKAPVIVGADALRRFVGEIFARKGMSEAHAVTVADALVWANLRGVDSHGVSRVPRYVQMIEAGDLNTAPAINVSQETPASVLIDAGRAAGPVAMSVAIEAAMRKASGAGIGLALVRATTHAAALGYYALKAADRGYAAIITAASIPNMAYHGSRAAGVSTSPLCVAVPGGDHGPLMLDMGTGVVSIGKLAQARREGKPIPEQWALDKDGNRTSDATRAEIPLPMAGPKGSGLALL
jgi:LDH2 family malate/lactate/ureidoglycolate dehydrogenase